MLGSLAGRGGRRRSGNRSCLPVTVPARLRSGDLGPGTGGVPGVSALERGEYDPFDLNRSELMNEGGGVRISGLLCNDSTLDAVAIVRPVSS